MRARQKLAAVKGDQAKLKSPPASIRTKSASLNNLNDDDESPMQNWTTKDDSASSAEIDLHGLKFGSEVETLNPDSPLLSKYQSTINLQLKKIVDQLDLELKEQETSLNRQKKAYVDVAQNVINAQNDLAKSNAQLAQLSQQLQQLADAKSNDEQVLHELRLKHQQLEKNVEQLYKKEKAARDKLSKLESLVAKESYFNEADSHKIAQNAVKKAASDLLDKKHEKEKQDSLIQNLLRLVLNKEEQLAQLEQQRLEVEERTESKRRELAELNDIAQSINAEKENLYKQWSQTVEQIKNHDKNAAHFREEAKHHFTQLSEKDSEMMSLAKEFHSAQADAQRLVDEESKLQKEVNAAQQRIGQLKLSIQDHNKQLIGLRQNTNELSKSYQQSKAKESELKTRIAQLEMQQKSEQSEINSIQEQLARSQTFLALPNAAVYEKLLKENAQKHSELDRLEEAFHNAENNYKTAQSNATAAKQAAVDAEQQLIEKQSAVAAVQRDIDLLRSVVDKKKIQLSQMRNKRAVQAMQSAHPPASIAGSPGRMPKFSKKHAEERIAALKAEWLRVQENMINLSAKLSHVSASNERAQQLILELEQGQLRVEHEISGLQVDISTLQKTEQDFRNQIKWLNDAIQNKGVSRDAILQHSLTDNHIADKLNESELELVNLQQKIGSTKEQNEHLLRKLTEKQKEYSSWVEKVKQLEEMSKPNEDEKELGEKIQQMRSKLQKYQQNVSKQNLEQEKMANEMEKLAATRELFIPQNLVLKQRSSNAAQMQNNRLKSQIDRLQKDLGDSSSILSQLNSQYQSLLAQSQTIQANLEEIQKTNLDLKATKAKVLVQKALNNAAINVLKQRQKIEAEGRNGKFLFTQMDDSIEQEMSTKEKLLEVLGELKAKFPVYQAAIVSIEEFLTSDL